MQLYRTGLLGVMFLTIVTLGVLAPQRVLAASQTVLTMNSTDPNEWIGGGQQYKFTPADGTFLARVWSPPSPFIEIVFYSPDRSQEWFMQFAAPTGNLPTRGQYEAAVRRGFQGARPGLDVTGNGHGCNLVFGRFLISELTFDASHDIQSFAADFEQICDPQYTAGELFGSIRYNSGVSITPRVSAGVPSAARKGSAGTSNALAVVSLSMPSDKVVTADFGTLDGTAVQGTDYVATSGRVTFQPGQTGLVVTVPIIGDREARGNKRFGIRVRNSNTLLGARSASVQILDPNIPLNVIAAQSEHSGLRRDAVGQGYSYVVTDDDDIFSTSRSSSDNSVTVSAAGPFTWLPPSSWQLIFAAPYKSVLLPGTYENAQRWPFQRPGRPGLSVAIEDRECNTIAGRFVINQIDYQKNGVVKLLSADFEQHCDGAKLGLFGWVRIKAPLQQASITNAEINGSAAVFTVTLNPASTKQEALTSRRAMARPSPGSIIVGFQRLLHSNQEKPRKQSRFRYSKVQLRENSSSGSWNP